MTAHCVGCRSETEDGAIGVCPILAWRSRRPLLHACDPCRCHPTAACRLTWPTGNPDRRAARTIFDVRQALRRQPTRARAPARARARAHRTLRAHPPHCHERVQAFVSFLAQPQILACSRRRRGIQTRCPPDGRRVRQRTPFTWRSSCARVLDPTKSGGEGIDKRTQTAEFSVLVRAGSRCRARFGASMGNKKRCIWTIWRLRLACAATRWCAPYICAFACALLPKLKHQPDVGYFFN